MPDPVKCPECGSYALATITEGVPAPHRGKLVCGSCGHLVKWLGAPAADFVMPFGKHKGKTIAEVAAVDRQHLEWVRDKSDYSNPKIRDKVREFLGESGPAPPSPTTPPPPVEWGCDHSNHPLQRRRIRDGEVE